MREDISPLPRLLISSNINWHFLSAFYIIIFLWLLTGNGINQAILRDFSKDYVPSELTDNL